MRRQNSIFANLDWWIVFLYLLLVFIGWLNIYSAVYNEEFQSMFDISQRYGKQLLWIGTSLVLATIILLVDERFFSTFAYPIYAFLVFLLIMVMVVGQEVKGATSWFSIGGFAVQPSEFAKFATNLALAKYLSSLHVSLRKFKDQLISFAIIGFPSLLILLQNDTGSALVYLSFILVLYKEGMSGTILVIGVIATILFIFSLYFRNEFYELPFDINLNGTTLIAVVLAVIFIMLAYLNRKRLKFVFLLCAILVACITFVKSVDYIFDEVLEPHQSKRINVMLGLESDPQGAGYNVRQSLIAIGSGGFSGKGYLEGTQTKYNFVPEQSTDFIFCTIGEEWGFMGSLVIISLFLILLIRIIIVSSRQRSDFARVYGYGVACILFFHFTINIGMTIGLVPVIGIPLPFFSYGGSSLWAFTILLFVFLKMDAERMHVL